MLRNVDAAGFNAEVAEAGEDLRKRKKFAAAVQALRQLANTELFTPTVRYQLFGGRVPAMGRTSARRFVFLTSISGEEPISRNGPLRK